MHKQRRAALLGASALTLLMAVGVAHAQTTGGATTATPSAVGVADVIVTATRREAVNTLQVPLAVDAYSGQTIEHLDIHDEDDLAKLDPSLNIQNFGAVSERIIIRGISSDVGATTGVYLDETPLEGGFNQDNPGDNTPTLGLRDVDHVEVLKGPQGTLFGAGSMDGTVRIVTNQPDLESYSGWVDTSLEDVNHGDALFQGGGGVNIPIIKDTLGLRLTAWGDDGGGYINQIIDGHTLDAVNNEQIYGLRAELLWKPNDKLSILGTASYQSAQVDGSQFWTPYVAGLVAPYSPPVGPYPAYTNALPSQEPFTQEFQLYSTTAHYDLGFGSIIANTAYGYKNENSISDTSAQDCIYDICEGTGVFPPATYSAHPAFWYSEDEIRFASDFKGPVQVVAGVYYEHDHQVYDGSVVNVNPVTGAAPCYTWNSCTLEGYNIPGVVIPFGEGASEVQFANESRQTTDQVAVYGQADWKITPTLTATAGIRYFTANIEYELITQQNIAPNFATAFSFNCAADSPQNQAYLLGCVTRPYLSASLGGTQSQPTYNFALLWQATPDVSFYARAASGFRIGGLNEAATIASQAGLAIPNEYAPDSLWDYEAGVKVYLLDRKLFLDVTGFHVDWSNEQLNALAFGIYGYEINAGKTQTNGVEVNTTYRPIPNLTLSGGFTYVDAELAADLPANVVDAGTPGVKGDPLPFVPHWTATGQAEYDHPLNDQFTGYLSADFTYHGASSSAFHASTPLDLMKSMGVNDYDTAIPAYFLLDLKAGVRWDKYDVSIFARNVTDEVAWEGANPGDGGTFVYSARPQSVGVEASAKF